MLAAASSKWADAGYYLMILSAHAGLCYLSAAVVARDLYRRGYSRVQGGRSSRKRAGLLFLDSMVHRLFFFLPHPVRLLILKDLRTFLRDPAQWSQFLIFFGLLAFYFLNIPRLGYGAQSPYWRNLVSFLNLSVTALILSTFTSRFIFPLLSLEGRNFWVLGLLPLSRDQILWAKFVFSAGISLVSTEFLVILSDLMLRMNPLMIALARRDDRRALLGPVGDQRRPGGSAAEPPGIGPIEDRRGVRRDVQSRWSAWSSSSPSSWRWRCRATSISWGRTIPSTARFILSRSGLRFWLTTAIIASLALSAAATIIPLRVGVKAFPAHGVLTIGRITDRSAGRCSSASTTIATKAGSAPMARAHQMRPRTGESPVEPTSARRQHATSKEILMSDPGFPFLRRPWLSRPARPQTPSNKPLDRRPARRRSSRASSARCSAVRAAIRSIISCRSRSADRSWAKAPSTPDGC